MTTTATRIGKARTRTAANRAGSKGTRARMTATATRVPDAATLDALHGRSLLVTEDWSVPELDVLLAVARRFQQLDRAGRPLALLPDQLAYALFFDNSTRTKSAWAGAAARLGMRPVIVDGTSTQVEHGETAAETGAMLGMNSHALGVRHDLILGEGQRFMREVLRGITDYLAATGDARKVPVVNLQCDVDHPTQTLADLMWLRERFPGGLRGRKIAVTWAYSPSYAKPLSVPQGLITLLTRFGAEVRLAHPEGYSLLDECVASARRSAAATDGSFRVVESMDEAFAGADAVYPKSWGPRELMLERVEANRARDAARMREIERKALERNASHRDWICDERRMGLTAGGRALYMHCLPADIGAEVSPGVMKRAALDVARQANWKVYVIMALLAVAKVKDLARRLAGVTS
jgi:knotted carbamoyltransferase YgeW